jgi:ribosomal-protein-alanine N-acetyltransferase
VPDPDFHLETARLRLRRYRHDDLDALATILGDPETMQYYPAPFSREESRRWIEQNLQRYRDDGYGLWAMELRTTGRFAGNCGLVARTVDGADEVEIGWHVDRHLWRQGLATEAAIACRDYAASELGIARLISLIRPVNTPSRRVAEKIGLTIEKEVPWGPERWPHLVYASPPPGSASGGSAQNPIMSIMSTWPGGPTPLRGRRASLCEMGL